MRSIAAFFILIAFLCVGTVSAESPYIREGSIGKPNQDTTIPHNDPTAYRSIDKWIGEKFIFLPKQKSLQKYGYQMFRSGSVQPSYEECVGRIGTIIEVTEKYSQRITIMMDDNGQTYTGWGSDSVDGIAPVVDIDFARNKWKGKTLWYVRKDFATYDENSNKFGGIKVKKYSPVKIIDIVAGWDHHQPVRFILQTDSGEEGFVDVNLSGTNVSLALRKYMTFDDFFLTENPRIIYKWLDNVWDSIENGNVFVGMTEQQAIMSWGKPKQVNKTTTGKLTHDQWVYGGGNYLYFENGILTSIQN